MLLWKLAQIMSAFKIWGRKGLKTAIKFGHVYFLPSKQWWRGFCTAHKARGNYRHPLFHVPVGGLAPCQKVGSRFPAGTLLIKSWWGIYAPSNSLRRFSHQPLHAREVFGRVFKFEWTIAGTNKDKVGQRFCGQTKSLFNLSNQSTFPSRRNHFSFRRTFFRSVLNKTHQKRGNRIFGAFNE